MVVAVEYISKEESTDVAEGAASAQHGVTGILAVQGAFAEHAAMLDRLGAPWKLLRAAEDFDDSIDRVILPGGESTTQGKLLYGRQLGSFAATADFGSATGDFAVSVAPGERVPESAASESIVLKDFPLVFIRGPFVAEVGERATVETSVDGNVVGLRQGKILATAFHPELTDDTRIHELFLGL